MKSTRLMKSLANLAVTCVVLSAAVCAAAPLNPPTTVTVDTNYQGGTWSSGNLTINPGITATLDNGFSFAVTAGSGQVNGGGTLSNDGDFDHNFSSLIYVRDGTTFDNTSNGNLNFNNNNGWIHLNGGANGTFRNLGGTINSGGNNVLLDGSGGTFTTFDGSLLHDLNLNVTSGQFTINVGNGDQVRLNSVSVASGTTLTLSVPATFTQNGGGAINFNQPGRIVLGNFDMGAAVNLDAGGDHGLVTGTINNGGNDMTLFAGRTLDVTGGFLFNGTGSFINNGDINYNFGSISRVRQGATFDNNGTLSFNNNGAWMHLNGGANGTFRNLGGTINSSGNNVLLDGSSGTFTTFDGSLLHDLNLNVTSGQLSINVGNGDQVRLNTVNVASGSTLTLSVPATFTQNGGGAINFNQPGRIVLGNFDMGAAVNLDAGGDHGLIGGTINNGGNDMTLFAGRTLDITGGVLFDGTGSFINNGVINYNFGSISRVREGATFENNGMLSFNNNGAWLHLNGGANGTVDNTATGVITKDATIAKALIDGTGGTFNNEGTLFVPGGELEIGPMSFAQFSSGALTGGTYIVDSTATGTAQLDLQPAAGMTTIGGNAVVRLTGTGADFVQLSTSLSNINGVLGLADGKQLTVSNMALGSSGTLEFGLNDLASSNSQLNVTGTLFADGVIDILDSGGLEEGIYDLVVFGGTLTDAGITLGSTPPAFSDSYVLSLIVPASGTVGGVIQLGVIFVPEPSSMSLVAIGAVAVLRTARRRNAHRSASNRRQAYNKQH